MSGTYSWTQAICDDCWDVQRPEALSPRVGQGDTETCAYCGARTCSGIYRRDDPATVAYPRPKDHWWSSR